MKLENQMKKVIQTLTFLLILFLFAFLGFTQANREINIPKENFSDLESNYLAALNSENEGIKVNSTYILGEIKSKRAVIPLMDIFRNDKNDCAKLVAAWSLFKIADPRGIFLIKRSLDLEENKQINLLLENLYKQFSSNSDISR